MAAQPKYNALYHDDWAWSLAAMGATNEEIADAMGVSKRTILRWAKEHESFGKALSEGKGVSDAKVIRSLYQRATGYEYTEEKKIVEIDQKDGSVKPVRVETIKKHVPPDVAAQCFCITDRAKHRRVVTRLPQDPGQAGKAQAESFLKFLSGFSVKILPESGDKVTRAEPFSAQWLGLEGMDKGNVDVLVADWNEMYFNQMENFPQSKFKDMVDGSSSAFNEIENGGTYSAPPTDSSLGKSSYWKK